MERHSLGQGRLIIVANRHPVTVTRNGPGDYTIKTSSGGLVTGLSGLPKSLKDNSVYYGWPGINVPEDEIATVEKGMADKGGVAIWIDQKLMDLHYNGYSSKSLLPHRARQTNVVQIALYGHCFTTTHMI